jgi:DNA-binding MarR family transcriptional regulator
MSISTQSKLDFLEKQREHKELNYGIVPFIYNELVINRIITFKQFSILSVLFNMNKHTTINNLSKQYNLDKKSLKKDLEVLRELELVDLYVSNKARVGNVYFCTSVGYAFSLLSKVKDPAVRELVDQIKSKTDVRVLGIANL